MPALRRVCLILTLLGTSWPARRLLLYFFALFFIMTVLGVIQPKRVMLISAWLILPARRDALGTLPKRFLRQTILASLVVIAMIGWLGILSRNLYAAPRWIEPWDKVAKHATEVIRNGGIVIGNNPSFFFYMTYSLPD